MIMPNISQQDDNLKGTWLKPHYYDDESMVEKLGTGVFYQETYFTDKVSITELESSDIDMPIERWSARDEHQLCHESLQWLDYNGDEIDGLCIKTEQHSIQKGAKVFGDKGKESAMKEMRSLAIKNQCFEELEYESLTQE